MAAAYPHLPLRPSESASVGVKAETGPVREGRSEAHVTVWWDLVSLSGNLDCLTPCLAAPTRSARAIANYRSRPSVFTTKYIEFSPRQARRPTRHF